MMFLVLLWCFAVRAPSLSCRCKKVCMSPAYLGRALHRHNLPTRSGCMIGPSNICLSMIVCPVKQSMGMLT